MDKVRVEISVYIDPPQIVGGSETVHISKKVGHSNANGGLVLNDTQVSTCVEEAVEVAAQSVLAMVEAEFPREGKTYVGRVAPSSSVHS